MEFNRQQVLLLVNRDAKLSKIFLENIPGDVEQKLRVLYDEYIVASYERREAYQALEQLLDKPIRLMPDSPMVAEIRRLVDEYGWEDFIRGVGHYAEKKMIVQQGLGLTQRAAAWKAIKEKIDRIRKNARL